ncbi:FKBP-type peptidyl-prolyl cis-trans isomerase [Sphingomonas sp. QA11]|uniref:FKBP-type peptidyl-prolyl cis-trans isomerase n=1 Tax=Sphingomonas sp. QA11 TaxID=2950605 RepID=UPI002349A1AD|nr:FKBP-type peptidyl-prolyl cis-trans isomerase [Sphingomonas sp. QA11]WCM29706.1 FKBP-type peptidyl-prolyl cis-trans isomerase [Sphingomonas sp. QA11]
MSTITAVPLQPTKRSILVYLWIGILAVVLAAGWLATRGTAEVVALKGSNAQFLAWNKGRPGVVETASGLQYKVLKAGEGALPTKSDIAGVMYVGRLRDGTIFDASQQPTPIPLSGGGAIPGFVEALKLMPKDAKYRVWLKPELAYGEHSPDPAKIPNGSILVFDVDMLGFIPEAVYRQQMMQQQMMQQQMPQGGPPPSR